MVITSTLDGCGYRAHQCYPKLPGSFEKVIEECVIGMGFDDYKVVLYRNHPEGWVAEIPSIPGCHALTPTAEESLGELAKVFRLIEEEHRENGTALPRDTTAIVHA